MPPKLAANLLIAVFLLSFAIEAPPVTHPARRVLVDAVGPPLDAVGLGQGGWQLFAPLPQRVNRAVRAEVTLDDGTSIVWRSPQWRTLPWWRKTFLVRHVKLYHQLGLDSSSAVWPHLCRWAIAELAAEIGSRDIARVELVRDWAVTPVPAAGRNPLPSSPPVSSAVFFVCPPERAGGDLPDEPRR